MTAVGPAVGLRSVDAREHDAVTAEVQRTMWAHGCFDADLTAFIGLSLIAIAIRKVRTERGSAAAEVARAEIAAEVADIELWPLPARSA